MYKSKLFNILQSFDGDDWTQMKRYLASQINTKSDPYILYIHIYKYKQDLSHQSSALIIRAAIYTLTKHQSIQEYIVTSQ